MNGRITRTRSPARNGLTLIEVLIAMFIITMLVQLLLPVIEMSRESARRTSCGNNLRELGIGMLSHEAAQGHFPAGGWGYLYVGDPDRGFGEAQPGGWIYNTLPYIDQTPLHDLGKGLTGAAKISDTKRMMATPLALLNCPSRRPPHALPFDIENLPYRNYEPPDNVAKSDYAGNAGDVYTSDCVNNEGPPSYEEAANDGDGIRRYWIDTSPLTGVFFQRSTTKVCDVADGLSSTYLVGEKYVDALRYQSRMTTMGDDQCMYLGADEDVIRWARNLNGGSLAPKQDQPNVDNSVGFGSPHPNSFQMIFCDGSVRPVSYFIDIAVHCRQANRRDGKKP